MSNPVEDRETREAFADFLRHVAAGSVRTIEWSRFIITHYRDEVLEDVRRGVSKLVHDRGGGVQWSESELAKLQHWSRLLRGETPSSMDDLGSPEA